MCGICRCEATAEWRVRGFDGEFDWLRDVQSTRGRVCDACGAAGITGTGFGGVTGICSTVRTTWKYVGGDNSTPLYGVR